MNYGPGVLAVPMTYAWVLYHGPECDLCHGHLCSSDQIWTTSGLNIIAVIRLRLCGCVVHHWATLNFLCGTLVYALTWQKSWSVWCHCVSHSTEEAVTKKKRTIQRSKIGNLFYLNLLHRGNSCISWGERKTEKEREGNGDYVTARSLESRTAVL